VKIGDQGKLMAPNKVCYICVTELRKWSKGQQQAFTFVAKKIWREPKNHSDDRYFMVAMLPLLLSPFHIKLGTVDQPVTVLPKMGNCCNKLCKTFHHTPERKLK
jgi:hypothetical protein